jgi:hypothetical protein
MIDKMKGDWYPVDIPQSSMKGLQGYKVCFAVSFR